MHRLSILVGLVAAAAVSAPAAADWLQMRDGSRVETKGPWQTRGAQIVFTLPNGRLASARAADVDLEASTRITSEAAAPKPAPAAPASPARQPAAVLTDEDLGPAAAVPASDAAGTGASTPSGSVAPGPAAAAARAPASGALDPSAGLEVMTWVSKYDAQAGSTTLTGTVRNTGDNIAFDVAVVASVFDEAGELLAKIDTKLTRDGLQPGGSSTFETSLPGLVRIEKATFALSARRAQLTPFTDEPEVETPPQATVTEGAVHLRVVRWDRDPEVTDAISVVGELQNPTANSVQEVQVEVRLLGEGGEVLASRSALVAATRLTPGQTTSFRATFPGIERFTKADFVARHRVAPAGG